MPIGVAFRLYLDFGREIDRQLRRPIAGRSSANWICVRLLGDHGDEGAAQRPAEHCQEQGEGLARVHRQDRQRGRLNNANVGDPSDPQRLVHAGLLFVLGTGKILRFDLPYVPRQLGDPDFVVVERRQALFQQAELGLQVLFLGSQRRLVGGVLGGDRRDQVRRDSVLRDSASG